MFKIIVKKQMGTSTKLEQHKMLQADLRKSKVLKLNNKFH